MPKTSEDKILREVVEKAYLDLFAEVALKEATIVKLMDKLKIAQSEIKDLTKQLDTKEKAILKLEQEKKT